MTNGVRAEVMRCEQGFFPPWLGYIKYQLRLDSSVKRSEMLSMQGKQGKRDEYTADMS